MKLLLLSILLAGFSGGKPKKADTCAAFISLKPQAVCRGVRIILSDIADINTVDPKLKSKISSIDLGRPPAEGWTRIITRENIKEAINSTFNHPLPVKFLGAIKTEVVSKTIVVSQESIEQSAEFVLKAVSSKEADDIEWSIYRHPRPVRVPAGRFGVDLSARIRKGKIGRDQAIIDVDIKVDGKTVETLPVQFRIRRFREVLVTLSPVRRGEPLEGKVGIKRMEISHFFGKPLTDINQIKNKVASRLLMSGRIVTDLDIKDPELVRKGDIVTMVGIKGNLRITIKGIARTGGSLGEMVKVMNPSTRRIIVGRVVGFGVVEVVRK